MQLDGALGDAKTGRLQGLRTALHAIGTRLIGHRCRRNIDRPLTRRYFSRDDDVQRNGMTMATTSARVIGPRDGKTGFLGSIGVRFMLDGMTTGGGFSLVEHPMAPRALAAPLHRHLREDEYSYVARGPMGALLGDEVVHAHAGDLVCKPRGQWHTFWNAGDAPCRSSSSSRPPASSDSSRSCRPRGHRCRRSRGSRGVVRALRDRDRSDEHPGPGRALRRALPRGASRAMSSA